jgi:hypothetical protein
MMTSMQLSPLSPLKGKTATNNSLTKFTANPPLRGSGVNK